MPSVMPAGSIELVMTSTAIGVRIPSGQVIMSRPNSASQTTSR